MVHLITNHEPYHVHKTLGLFALFHFGYRFHLLFTTANAFPADEHILIPTVCFLSHGLLSWSSLLLPLPEKRNYSSPMIWPEFRLHSITFATRHVVCGLLTLHKLWPSHPLLLSFSNAAVILGTITVASEITDRYGDREKRTTNALPYPEHVTEEAAKGIKLMYAKAQFAATHVCILHDSSINFFCLCAIQMAPFLMTLVRKGKIGATAYHQVYAFSLWVTFVVTLVRFLVIPDLIFFGFAGFSSMLVRDGRIRYHVDNRLLWALHVFNVRFVYPKVSIELVRPFVVPLLLVSIVQQVIAYLPLFLF